MATRNEDEGGSRLWRGMRSLLFGEGHEETLRDQIEEAIDEAEDEPIKRGDLSPTERQMLRNLLHFGDRTVGEVAVTRGDIVSVRSTVTFDELIAAFAEAEHSRLPVTGDDLDEVIGMIHIKDVFKAQKDPTRPRTIEGLLRAPLFVPESMGVLDLLARMRTERMHLAIVVDEFGGTEGLVTIEDVVEEIVGEIEDEHDVAEEAMIREDPRLGLVADARTPIEDLARHLGVELVTPEQEEDIDTIGGLVFSLAGRIPARGELVRHPSGIEFEVLDADPRRIKKLRIHSAQEREETPTETPAPESS